MFGIFIYATSKSNKFVVVVLFQVPMENHLSLISLSLFLGTCFSFTEEIVKFISCFHREVSLANFTDIKTAFPLMSKTKIA